MDSEDYQVSQLLKAEAEESNLLQDCLDQPGVKGEVLLHKAKVEALLLRARRARAGEEAEAVLEVPADQVVPRDSSSLSR